MTSIGEILKEKRLSQNISLDQLADLLKVKKKLLSSLEENSFSVFAGEVYLTSLVVSYCEVLNLDQEKILPYLKRSYSQFELAAAKQEVKKETKLAENTVKDAGVFDSVSFFSRFIITAGFIIIFVFSSVFLFLEYKKNVLAPSVFNLDPKSESIIKVQNVEITGETTVGNSISINNQRVFVGKTGRFTFPVTLRKGVNKFTIKVVNDAGKCGQLEYVLYWK